MPSDRFEELISATNWSKVSHAYGQAEDVPDQLRDLVSDYEEIRSAALQQCYANIFHQGTRYTASAKAVPCIIELLENDRPELANLLTLLVYLGVGYHESFLEVGFDYRELKKTWGRNAFGKTYRAFAEGADRYLELLDYPIPKVRSLAAFLLAFITDARRKSVPALEQRIATEGNVSTKGCMLISLGMLLALGDISCQEDPFESLSNDDDELLRACAVMGACYAAPEKVGDESFSVLKAATGSARLRETDLPWNDGDLASLGGILIARVGAHSTANVLPALILALENAVDGTSGLQAAETLLDRLFEFRPTFRPMPHTVDDDQRQALTSIHNSDHAWQYGNMGWAMTEYGLPENRKLLGIFLGVVDCGLPGLELKVELDGQQQKIPAWVLCQLMSEGKFECTAFAAAIVEQLNMEQALELCFGPLDHVDIFSPMKCSRQQEVHLDVSVIELLGSACDELLVKFGEQIIDEDVWATQARLAISVGLTRFAQQTNTEISELVDKLMWRVIPQSPASRDELEYPLAEEVLNALPEDRRVAQFLDRSFPTWRLYKLCPAEEILPIAVRFLQWPDAEMKDFIHWGFEHSPEVLVDLLVNDGSPPVREALAEVLSGFSTEFAITTLFGLFNDSSVKTRRATVASLAKMPLGKIQAGLAEAKEGRLKKCREAAAELEKLL